MILPKQISLPTSPTDGNYFCSPYYSLLGPHILSGRRFGSRVHLDAVNGLTELQKGLGLHAVHCPQFFARRCGNKSLYVCLAYAFMMAVLDLVHVHNQAGGARFANDSYPIQTNVVNL